MALKNYKVFIVGCGSIGKRHTECLHDIGIRKFVFFDPEITRSTELAQIYDGTTVNSYEEGLATDVDCVYLLTPTGLHIPQAKSAIELGKACRSKKGCC